MTTAGLARKILCFASLGALIAAFVYFDLGRYLTLSYLQATHQRYHALYAEHRVVVIAGYAAVYILVAVLSIPGAGVMTLAAGALFGLVTGTIVVSFASSIGATLACAVSRFLLADWVEERFSDRIARINEGLEREGAFYLFMLRMIPVVPYGLINLVMGITRMRLFTFFWVSQVGMLAVTIVYVNAGKQLSEVNSAADILSPDLLLSLALLGLFPLASRRVLLWYRKRRTGSAPAGEGGEQ